MTDVYDFLIEAMVVGGSNAIENQEKRGQTDLVNSAKLPIKCGKREQFEKLGIVFGEDIDDLFVSATLPDGWKVQPTDHSMWSNLVDESGEEVASIFYKAAFYDRDAFMTLSQKAK